MHVVRVEDASNTGGVAASHPRHPPWADWEHAAWCYYYYSMPWQ